VKEQNGGWRVNGAFLDICLFHIFCSKLCMVSALRVLERFLWTPCIKFWMTLQNVFRGPFYNSCCVPALNFHQDGHRDSSLFHRISHVIFYNVTPIYFSLLLLLSSYTTFLMFLFHFVRERMNFTVITTSEGEGAQIKSFGWFQFS